MGLQEKFGVGIQTKISDLIFAKQKLMQNFFKVKKFNLKQFNLKQKQHFFNRVRF